MAESMLGLKRSHRCTEVTSSNAGETVTVMGWVQKSRNKGGIIFVDLRDRSGILQIIFVAIRLPQPLSRRFLHHVPIGIKLLLLRTLTHGSSLKE